MKTSEVRQIVVGMLTIVVLAALLATAYANQFIDEQINLGGRYRLVAVFNRVDGLAVGSDVTLSGVKIGTVESMRLDDKYQAWVTLQIDDDIRSLFFTSKGDRVLDLHPLKRIAKILV